jgi:nucleotide-binding universal stress UspA family protein
VPVQLRVQRDHPAHALIEQLRGAQLVVVGSRGHGWLAGLVLGSVGHTLMHRTHCPVAVVRPENGGG